MLRQLCIKCGKAAEIDNLCKECFLQQPLFEVEDFHLLVCGNCGSYYDREWHKESDEGIKEMIGSRIKTPNKIIKKNMSLKRVGNRILADVLCTGSIKGRKKSERRSVIITTKRKMCDNCVKLSGGYYEAVLQARGENADSIAEKISGMLAASIVRMEKVKNGYDIKIMDKGQASKVINLGYDVKKTFKLVGEKKGKKLIRDCYSIR